VSHKLWAELVADALRIPEKLIPKL
jgi:hypothetical protein